MWLNLIVGYELPAMGVILFMMLVFLVMGMFMDWVGIVLLIMPVFLPIVRKLPIEEIGFLGTLEPRYIAVWFGVVFLYEYAGIFPVPSVWTSSFLPQICSTAAYISDRYFQRVPAFYRYPAIGTFCAAYLATNCNGVFRVGTARLCPFGKNHISPIWHLSPQMGVFICKGQQWPQRYFWSCAF